MIDDFNDWLRVWGFTEKTAPSDMVIRFWRDKALEAERKLAQFGQVYEAGKGWVFDGRA